ncbi:MAG: branched-chain amino acid ABC transporter permease [Candidatus Dormibacteria bacterium]
MDLILPYLATLVVFFFIYNIFTWGLNIQFGYAGVLDFTFITFVACGAYFAGVFALGPGSQQNGFEWILGLNLPFPIALLAGALAAGVLGILIGLIAINRLRSDYMAIVTLATGTVIYGLVSNFTPLFDGFDGLAGLSPPFAQALGLNSNQFTYLWVVVSGVVMVICWFIAQRILTSPLGRTMRAIREDQDAAETFGKDTIRVRLIAMSMGAVLAGVGGALLMGFIGAFSPAGWTSGETFVVWAALIVGGRGNNWGAVVGSFVVAVLINEATRYIPPVTADPTLIPTVRNMLIGATLILVLWVRPQGIIPETRRRFFQLPLRPGSPPVQEAESARG